MFSPLIVGTWAATAHTPVGRRDHDAPGASGTTISARPLQGSILGQKRAEVASSCRTAPVRTQDPNHRL
jgi:hypothetical protein